MRGLRNIPYLLRPHCPAVAGCPTIDTTSSLAPDRPRTPGRRDASAIGSRRFRQVRRRPSIRRSMPCPIPRSRPPRRTRSADWPARDCSRADSGTGPKTSGGGFVRGAAEIAAPLVFLRVTRPMERRRGHHRCAAGLGQLAHDCLDRFHDDVDAVLHDLFAHADLPIGNLEGWLTMRMPRATVDGYRRRRGERGAPQRPRVPVWLATELGDEAWLVELAKAILDWAGTDATAGGSLWPLTAWAERRSTPDRRPHLGRGSRRQGRGDGAGRHAAARLVV